MPTYAWFGKTIQGIFTGGVTVDWDTDTIKAGLITATLAPDVDVHDFWDDLVANEVTGTGYTAGGVTLTGKSVALTGGSNLVALIAADAVWTTATISGIRYAIIYKSTGTNSTSPLIGTADVGAQSVTAANFTLDHDAVNGVMKGTY